MASRLEVFRGDLADVLDRFHGALEQAGRPEHFLRLTADCPLADPGVIDACVVRHLESGADYTHNTPGRTFPKGLDVEVCRSEVLDVAWWQAAAPYDREHVTPYIYNRPQRFKIATLTRHPPLRYRWTVDTLEDFEFVADVYAALYPRDEAFTSVDVLDWQEAHPHRVLVNDETTA